MAKLLYEKTTGLIIGVYYDVYNGAGRTYPEYIFENAMMGDLRILRVPCRRQVEYRIFYKVHSTLGPGFIHRIYANACYYELQQRGLEVRPRKTYQVIYRNRPIGEIKFGHLQVSNSVLVFPVAVQDINDIHISNLKDWMRVQRIPLGILANFYDTSLHPIVLRI